MAAVLSERAFLSNVVVAETSRLEFFRVFPVERGRTVSDRWHHTGRTDGRTDEETKRKSVFASGRGENTTNTRTTGGSRRFYLPENTGRNGAGSAARVRETRGHELFKMDRRRRLKRIFENRITKDGEQVGSSLKSSRRSG